MRKCVANPLAPPWAAYAEAAAAELSVLAAALPDRHPPPDLALEIDISRSSLDRMSIYAALRRKARHEHTLQAVEGGKAPAIADGRPERITPA